MYKIIDGHKIAEKIKDEITAEIFSHRTVRPNLAIILVGQREDSKLYVSLKEKEAKKVGVDTHLYLLSEEANSQELLEIIDFLNKDKNIDAILLQLPLPPQFNTDKIIQKIDPKKDADGFHPQKPTYIKSPVLASVEACLAEIKFPADEKTACILNKSEIFGESLSKLLQDRGFKICSKKDILKADLIVSARGEANSIKKEMMKKGVAIIDIGISKNNNKTCGDTDITAAREKASYLTPVPGGIGPMTIAYLFKNVLEIFRNKK